MDRRTFIKLNSQVALISVLGGENLFATNLNPNAHSIVSKWRGFNLYDLYYDKFQGPIQETDFQFMSEWGFNVARIPLNYWLWSDRDNWGKIDESFFRTQVDPVINYGKKYGIHICICIYRAPGYCVNRRNLEKADLFVGSENNRADAKKAFIKHWQFIANRYKKVSTDNLSFNLLNEPPSFYQEKLYLDLINPLITAIRQISSSRKLIIDGMNVSTKPVKGLIGKKNIVQSIHAYVPGNITHFSEPSNKQRTSQNKWPFKSADGTTWNKSRLLKNYQPWIDQGNESIPIFVGEWGVISNTPHNTALAFMKDQLEIFKQNNWGWALWNLRGAFGIMDSKRKDVKYQSYKGHQLDIEMLNLLKAYLT